MKKLAIQILVKKTNILEHQGLKDLVYIHYNLRLKNQYKYFLIYTEYDFFYLNVYKKSNVLFFRFYNKKKSYDFIDYACIDETEFWIINEDELEELDLEEMENLLYDEKSIPMEIEGLTSTIHIG